MAVNIHYYTCRCWVGKRHLDMAIEQLNKEDNYIINIRWKPFQLNPWLPEEGMRFREYAIKKFGEGGFRRFINGEVPFFEQGRKVVWIDVGGDQ